MARRAGLAKLSCWGCTLGAAGLLQCCPASPSTFRASWVPKAGSTADLRGFSRVAWIPSKLSKRDRIATHPTRKVDLACQSELSRKRSSTESAVLGGCVFLPIDSSYCSLAPPRLSPLALRLPAAPPRLTMLQGAGLACAMAHSVMWRTRPTCDTPCSGQAHLCLADGLYTVYSLCAWDAYAT